MRPAGLEPATLGLEIPCSIHLSYGREGVFCVSRDPLLDDLLGAGSGNTILYHGATATLRPVFSKASQQASAVRSAFVPT